MFVNVSTFRFRSSEDLDRAFQAAEKELAPRWPQTSGLRAYYDVRTGPKTWVSVTVWDDEGAFQRSLQDIAAWMSATLAPLLAGAPERTSGVTMGQFQR